MKAMPGTSALVMYKDYNLDSALGGIAKGFNDGMKNVTGGWWPW